MKTGGKILIMIALTLCAVGGVTVLTACARSPLTPASQPAAAPTLTSPAPAAQTSAALSSRPSGDLLVSLLSTPNPPIRGTNTLKATVTDAKGQPISDAAITFDLDMTNMSHGKNIVTASYLGGGQYSSQVFFMMPGPWRVIVRIERQGKTDSIRFDFNVNYR